MCEVTKEANWFTKISKRHGQFILCLCQYWIYFENANQEIWESVVWIFWLNPWTSCEVTLLLAGSEATRFFFMTGVELSMTIFVPRLNIRKKLYCTCIGNTFTWLRVMHILLESNNTPLQYGLDTWSMLLIKSIHHDNLEKI